MPCGSIDCYKRVLHDENVCFDAFVVWANQEYKESTVISYNDRLFLNFIKDEYEYISRDESGCLYAYVSKPEKYEYNGNWIGGTIAGLYRFNIDFPMIKWSDEQPWKITDLKKLKVVENY